MFQITIMEAVGSSDLSEVDKSKIPVVIGHEPKEAEENVQIEPSLPSCFISE